MPPSAGTPFRRPKKGRGRLRRCVLLLTVLLLLLLFWAWRRIEDAGTRPLREAAAPAIRALIDPGMTPRAAFRRLEEKRVIPSARMAEVYFRFHGGGTLRAGEYEFAGAMTLEAILRRLERGEVLLHTFTIPEGLTSWQAAERLEQSGVCSAGDYEREVHRVSLISNYDPAAADLEGYLFPDTYSFPAGLTAAEIVSKQVETFLRHCQRLRARGESPVALRDAVVLASLVEKETGRAEERPLVASVFVNRLRRGMMLQCDPTVIFALMIEGRYNGMIHRSDLAMDSPYNTYRHKGLPPGPICNPGAASLEAALYPPATDYLYFVAQDDQSHIFSTNLADHNRAVDRYRHRQAASN